MVDKFEVGKKYRYGRASCFEDTIYECVYIGEKVAVLRWKDCFDVKEVSYFKTNSINFKEYKEPQHIEKWVGVFKRGDGSIYFANYIYNNEKDVINVYGNDCYFVDTIKIEYTEKE